MNDIADSLAREGSMAYGPHGRTPIPDAHIKELIDKETERRWNNRWVHTEGHRQTKLFFPTVDKNKTEKLYKASNSIYSQAIRWITGFNGLAYQNNKMYPQEYPSPLCQLCEGLIEETSSHLISECPSLYWERHYAFKTNTTIDDLSKIKMQHLFSFLENDKVKMMENISEYPLLFVEDYNNVHHEIIDEIANHETSFSSRNDDDDDQEANTPISPMPALGDPPPAKRRDRRPSDRTGIG